MGLKWKTNASGNAIKSLKNALMKVMIDISICCVSNALVKAILSNVRKDVTKNKRGGAIDVKIVKIGVLRIVRNERWAEDLIRYLKKGEKGKW